MSRARATSIATSSRSGRSPAASASTSPSGETITVDYATADGSAAAGSDYVATSGPLTFTAGATTRNVTVTVNGDTLDELDETFFVNLSNPSNATISDDQGQGTVTDDDATPTLSIDDVTVTEGNSGTVDAVFTVSLSTASGQEVTVDYATADGTAAAGTDYAAASGTLTFPAGTTTRNVTVAVNGDTVDELETQRREFIIQFDLQQRRERNRFATDAATVHELQRVDVNTAQVARIFLSLRVIVDRIG